MNVEFFCVFQPGTGFSGNPAAGPEMGAQHAMASRQASMMGIAQESDVTGYRTHPAQAAQYGGPYASVYGSAALSSGQQVIFYEMLTLSF